MAVKVLLHQVNDNGISNSYVGTYRLADIPPIGGVVSYTPSRFKTIQGIVNLIVYVAVGENDTDEPAVQVVIDARAKPSSE